MGEGIDSRESDSVDYTNLSNDELVDLWRSLSTDDWEIQHLKRELQVRLLLDERGNLTDKT